MLKQTIKFKDFLENERETTLYFNLTEAELVDIQVHSDEGIQKEMEDAVKSKDLAKLLDFIKMLVHKSYGELDKDGIHFNKSDEITASFVNSAMYSPLLLSLFEDEGARAEKFITGLMPADLVRRALAQVQNGSGQTAPETPQYQPSARERFEQIQREKAVPEAEVIDLPQQYQPATPEPALFKTPEPAAPVQSSPSPLDAPPVDAQPFKVEAAPLDDDRAAFEAWKAQRGQQ